MHERVAGRCTCAFADSECRRGGRVFGWVRNAVLVAAAAAVAFSASLGGSARAAHLEDLEVVAHRGGADVGAEHTLRALQQAIDAGADAVEMDVRFTGDGVAVLLHDATLDRTTDCDGPVDGWSFAGLREQCLVDGGDRIPTLHEALAALAPTKAGLYLHLKTAEPDSRLEGVVNQLEEYGLNDGRRATTLADSEEVLARLDVAGANRLGLVFDDPRGWDAGYPVLVAYNTPLTPDLVDRALRRGSHVLAVQDHSLSLRALLAGQSAVTGFMAHQLGSTLTNLGRAGTVEGRAVRAHRPAEDAPPSDAFPIVGLDGA
ncbi:MAG: glycerophosphodiester phosphodiesterase [Sporichthyaceae bacterium]